MTPEARIAAMMALADEYANMRALAKETRSLDYIAAEPKCRAALESALRDALESPQGWISVKDRLPETAGYYLVLCGDGRWDIYYAYVPNVWQSVTHWMPLPAAPREPTK